MQSKYFKNWTNHEKVLSKTFLPTALAFESGRVWKETSLAENVLTFFFFVPRSPFPFSLVSLFFMDRFHADLVNGRKRANGS